MEIPYSQRDNETRSHWLLAWELLFCKSPDNFLAVHNETVNTYCHHFGALLLFVVPYGIHLIADRVNRAPIADVIVTPTFSVYMAFSYLFSPIFHNRKFVP